MSKTFKAFTGTASVFLVFLQLSCKDMGVPVEQEPLPPGTEVSFSQHIQPIFNNNGCTGCHPSSYPQLSLAQGQSYAQLVNVDAQAGCTTQKRVVPGNAAESVLFIRVSSNSADTDCGVNSRMPKFGSRLPQATIDVIEDWINEGAKNN